MKNGWWLQLQGLLGDGSRDARELIAFPATHDIAFNPGHEVGTQRHR